MGAAEPSERSLVAAQMGRDPRSPWRVAARCKHGLPLVIASPSRLSDGTPFPTTFWLTCPMLVDGAGDAESAGGVAVWEERLRTDPALAKRAERAAEAYRAARAAESGGVDACGDVGIAGVARPDRVKCLHARLAAHLAAVDDPVGAGVAAELPEACEDMRCALLGRAEGGL
jgi:uncharacterized protein